MKKFKIITLSDTHGKHGFIKIPKGDIIICAGDISATPDLCNTIDFLKWYSNLNFRYKILVPGNHD